MIFLFLIIVEIVLLFFLSRVLSRLLSHFLHRTTHSVNATIHLLAILFLPGTIIHELAHLIIAGVLFVPTGGIELYPRLQDNGVKLGSVTVAQTDPFRRAIIGFAPIFVGIGLLLALFYFFSSGETSFVWWQIVIGLYAVFEIGNTMFSSAKDMEGTMEVLVVLVIAIVVLFLLGLRPSIEVVNFLSSGKVNQFFIQITLFFSFPLLVDGVVISVIKLLTNNY